MNGKSLQSALKMQCAESKGVPLADDEGCARVLALLHHVQEVLLLRLTQRLKLLYRVNVDLAQHKMVCFSLNCST